MIERRNPSRSTPCHSAGALNFSFSKSELRDLLREFHRSKKGGVYSRKEWEAFIEQRQQEHWLQAMHQLEAEGLVEAIFDGQWRYQVTEKGRACGVDGERLRA